MSRSYSSAFHETLNQVSAQETPLLLLEIDHADLGAPIRVVNDTQDVVHLSNTFTALAFRAQLPDEPEEGMPVAQLAIDNVGQELVSWIDASIGGRGATVRMIQILRSDPDTIEWDITMDLRDVAINPLEVTGRLTFEDTLNRPAVNVTYRPDSHPGLY